jgi:hypothetical protein
VGVGNPAEKYRSKNLSKHGQNSNWDMRGKKKPAFFGTARLEVTNCDFKNPPYITRLLFIPGS